jgi:predicted permease
MTTRREGWGRLLRVKDARRDLDEELSFHFESVVEELMRGGRSRKGAEAEARRRFGDEVRYRRELERIDRGAAARRRWGERGDALLHTVRFAWRSLVRSRGLSVGIVLAFALGIGANSAMFGILDRLLLSPPAHIEQPEQVKRLIVDRYVSFMGRRIQGSTVAYGDYLDFTRIQGFDAVGAYSGRRRVTVGRGDDAEPVNAVLVTSSFWTVLGTRTALGRFFTEEEDRIGALGTAVIGWELWQRRFGGDPAVLGRTLDFGEGPYTIVGVAPRGFTGVNLVDVELWLPAIVTGAALQGPEWLDPDGRGAYWLNVIARVTPGPLEVVESRATAVHRAGRERDAASGRYDPESRVVLGSLIAARGPNASAESRVAKWLAGVSAIVLLIACVNVANLLLARGVRQRREIGIRLALGVSRLRLFSQTLVEGIILALIGAVAALLVSHWGGGALGRVLLPDVLWTETALASRALVFVLIMALVAGVASAIVPAFTSASGDVSGTLRSSAGGITRSTLRARGWLTTAQAALSVVLLVGAGLFVRSLQNVRSLDIGFDPNGVLLVRPVEDTNAFSADQRITLFRAAAERLGQIPGVDGATFTRGAPFYTSYADDLRAEGLDSIPSHSGGGPYIFSIGPDYFSTMRMRVLRGRGFDASDRATAPPVTIVNEAMARLLWPRDDALGKCLYIGEKATACSTIVGIAENSRRSSMIEDDPHPQYFVPFDQELARSSPERARPEMLLVRIDDESRADARADDIRRTLLALEPRLRFVHIVTLREELIDSQLRSWMLGATMFTSFGAFALLVAALGLYSVLAFDVAQRTREIGLRCALGANTRSLLGLIVRRALRLAAAGVALGLLAAAFLAPRLQNLLFQTSPHDPATLSLVAAVLLAVAAVAAALPAWRAARVDPNVALRAE